MGTELCREWGLGHCEELAALGCHSFEIEHQRRVFEVIVVHLDGDFHAYVNRCPHTGTALNWQPQQFLSVDGEYLQCATHGALFRRNDGLCIWGSCVGQSLTAVPVLVRDDKVVLRAPLALLEEISAHTV